MFFLLPIGVEGNQVRVPVVCLGILLLCIVGFIGTWLIPGAPTVDERALSEVKRQLEQHPYLELPPRLVEGLDDDARHELVGVRAQWLKDNPLPAPEVIEQEQRALNATAERFLLNSGGPMKRLALIPARGFNQWGWLTHLFLHFGWLHLIGNLLFFYICGPLLEDTWGRKLFAGFYLVGGLIAAFAQFSIDRHSQAMMVGASGAIAACMGAFAVRFATRKVAILYVVIFFRIIRGVWRWPAWVCGLLWFGSEALSALGSGGQNEGVAVMAHVGGFAFGALVAFGMKAIGLEKQFIPLSEETIGPIQASVLPEVDAGNQLLGQGDRQGARAKFEQGLKAAPDDLDAAIGLVKVDLQSGETGKALVRLEAVLGKLMRGKEDERAIAGLWQVWQQLEVGQLKPAFAFSLARAADAAGPSGEGLAEALYARAAEAPGLVGAKALLRAAELALKTTEPHLAGKYLGALLKRADAGPELLERARALKVPPPPIAAAAMASGLELDLGGRQVEAGAGGRFESSEPELELASPPSDASGAEQPGSPQPSATAAKQRSGTMSANDSAAGVRPPPKLVSCALISVTDEGLALQSTTGDLNALPFAKVLAVAAGLVPVSLPGAPPRGVLLVDLILGWGDASTAAVAVRLDSDTTAMSKLFPGASAALVYAAFFKRLLEASGATALTENLTSGTFPRFASVEARDLALFGPAS